MEGDSIMWVGTAKNGLNKYDFETQEFKTYYPNIDDPKSIPSEEVISLEHDPFGVLWVGFHKDGLSKYNKDEDSFEKIIMPEFEDRIKSRRNNIIKQFFFDEENEHVVWLITLQDFIRYDDYNKTFKIYSYFDFTTGNTSKTGSLGYGVRKPDGKFYIASVRCGILVFDPKTEKWSNYNDLTYNPLNYRENSYNKIQIRDASSFWLGSPKKGLSILDLKLGYIYPADSCRDDDSDQLCKLRISCMDMNAPEGYWIGTNLGLRLYNKQGNQFKIYKHYAGTKNLRDRTSIVAIHQHEKNGFYFGGYAGEGVYYFDIKSKTKSIIPPPDNYKIGVDFELFYTRSIIPYNDTTLIVLSDNGLFKLYTHSKKMEEIDMGIYYSKDFFDLNRIFKHTNGTYYISTRHNGVYILNANFKMIDHLFKDNNDSNSLVCSNYIYEICEDVFSNVWIGTEEGFSVFNPTNRSFKNSHFSTRLDSTPQLKIIISIKLAPDSSIWILDGRANAVKIDYPYTYPYHYESIITGKDSLSERIYNAYFVNDERTILTTNGGLALKKRDLDFERFNRSQGLPGLRALGPIEELSNGKVVIGSGRNLILFHPDSIHDIPKDPPIYITSITIFDEKYDANLNNITEEGLTFTYKQNYFSIGIGMINYDNPEEYKLSYRLKGLNDEWITDKDKKAVFTNVPGGSYVFEAKLLDKNNDLLTGQLSLPLEIVPPFWETLWFKIMGILLLSSIGFAFYYIRIHNIKKEEKLKTAFNKQIANMELSALRAQMNPHFLFNSLNSIRNKIVNNNLEDADKYLVKFSRLVRQVLQNSREQLINLKEEMETLNLYVDLESSRFEHRFKYELKIEEGLKLEKLRIPPLLLQPYVENAIWHGLMQKEEAGKVTISISVKNQSLIISINDDGIGREKAKELKSKTAIKSQSMGMGITGDRLEIIEKIYQLSCSATITDLKTNKGEALGTRITLTLPLIYES